MSGISIAQAITLIATLILKMMPIYHQLRLCLCEVRFSDKHFLPENGILTALCGMYYVHCVADVNAHLIFDWKLWQT